MVETLSSIVIDIGADPTINDLGNFLFQAQGGAKFLGYKESDLKLKFKIDDKHITISIVVDKLIKPPIVDP